MEGHGGARYSCAWSPDGTRLATTAGDMTVGVWLAPAATPASIADLRKHYVQQQHLAAETSAREHATANTRTEAANTRKRRLEGDPETLQGCSLEELRQVVADIERAGPRARDALTRAESSAADCVAAAPPTRGFARCARLTSPRVTACTCGRVYL